MSTAVARTLRIAFTTEDLARLRVADTPDPMWEIVLSQHILRTRRAGAVFEPWRRATARRLGSRLGPLLALNPPVGDFPDFLTPAGRNRDVGEGIDRMLSTPRQQLLTELGHRPGRLGSWPSFFAAHDVAARAWLGQAFETYHRIAIAPYWPVLTAAVELERIRLAGLLLDGGPALLLENLAPGVAWRGPVLAIRYPVDRELPLGGRGLLLVPSYFCWPGPVTLVDPARPPVLVYPLSHRLDLADPPERRPGGDRTLAKLLGPTRAAVLRTLERPCTTTDLSRRAGTSVTSASQHASILRGAGLVTTRRTGGAVRHSLTPLGVALLRTQR